MFDIELLSKSNEQIRMNLGDSLDLLSNIPSDSVDLVISSPPYCMGKEYEDISDDVFSFITNHKRILPEVIRVLKNGGSLCWQVGYHVKDATTIPLDILVYNIISEINESLDKKSKIILRNRIVWTFGHGLHSSKRLSGRHETILWFTKGDSYIFNLDEVRVPQKYPGKTYHKGKKKGQISGNPKGKNPSDVWSEIVDDVWDIPNVKSKHPEKTAHPCQFPSAIPLRLIKALSNEGDIVLDPFMGSGTTALAAQLTNRIFIGGELDPGYFDIAKNRLLDAYSGIISIRDDEPIFSPSGKEKVTQRPDYFTWEQKEGE